MYSQYVCLPLSLSLSPTHALLFFVCGLLLLCVDMLMQQSLKLRRKSSRSSAMQQQKRRQQAAAKSMSSSSSSPLHVCPTCGRIYQTLSTLTRHMRKECNQPKLFICHLCGQGFHYNFKLQHHYNHTHRLSA